MDTTYYSTTVLSCLVFLCIYKVVSPALSETIFLQYSVLPVDKKINWNSRIISSIHATVVSCLCFYTFIYDNEVSNDPIWYDSTLVRTSAAIVVGYMMSDLIIMTIHYKQIGEVFHFFHHGVSIYAYYFVMTYGVLPYFANFRLIAEFSTPFVNQRWFLGVLGYSKTSSSFVLNGAAMTVIFFMVRIACMPHYWWKVYSVYDTVLFNRLGYIRYVLVFTCLILDVINLFWFYKICRGIRKVLTQTLDKNRNISKLTE